MAGVPSLGWGSLSGGGRPVGWGVLLSRRPIVAVSAARLKVVAIERFARQRRSTLTRSATTAGWRLSGKGDGWSRSVANSGFARKLILSAWRPMPTTAPERRRVGCRGWSLWAADPEQHGLWPVGHCAGAHRLRVSRPVTVCGENPDDLATGGKIIPMLEHIYPLCLRMHTRLVAPFPVASSQRR